MMYFVGIIDILTNYGALKKAAHAAKTVKHGVREIHMYTYKCTLLSDICLPCLQPHMYSICICMKVHPIVAIDQIMSLCICVNIIE